MTPRNSARSTTAMRACVAFFVIVLALMNGDRPLGQTPAGNAVDFDGTNDFIALGQASGASQLGVANFTVELWFKREGAGATTSTGAGGLATIVPLVTKGMAQSDASTTDMNYFVGLNLSGGNYFLAADFEEGTGQAQPGLNHPVVSATPIALNTWYHAAATYNSANGTFRLYLNGVEQSTAHRRERRCCSASQIAHHGPIAFNTHRSVRRSVRVNGTKRPPAGFFNGVIDEVRIWNVVRTPAEILANKNVELTAGTGLIGRWGLNEAIGSTTATNSIAGRPNGTLTNGPARVAGFPIPDAIPPAIPQNVIANTGNSLVTIAWNANTDTDLASYNVYRNGSATRLNATPITSPIYTDATVTNGQQYTYVVTAVDTSSNESTASAQVSATPHLFDGAGIQFNDINQYVTFGAATGPTGLGAESFTLEGWIKRTGQGVGTSTGTGGFEGTSAIPLITKGRGEAEGSNVDMNYFLGIHAATGVLIADFEDLNGTPTSGGNHPASGITPIPVSTTTWHHVAATYGAGVWTLYLDGNVESTTSVGAFTPRSDSIQHAGIGTAMNSSGVAAGFFNGLFDEVRIWNYARSQAEIQAGMNQEIFVGPIGRWGLNEASGITVENTAGSTQGTVVGTPRWTAGYLFPPDVLPPAVPVDVAAIPGNAQVTIGWTANGEPDLAGYNVYRRTSSTTFGAPLNATLLTNPTYLDTSVTNETDYFYAVTAVDVFNNQSGLSNEASATPSTNPPPLVNAGPDRTITLSGAASLNGSASDNGPFTVLWSMFSGPGSVTFGNSGAAITTATFSQTGLYVLRLTANDGAKTAFDNMTVTVTDPVLVGAGDLAPNCLPPTNDSLANAHATATLLDGIPGTVFTLGDNAYQNGTADEFDTCYTPTWGRAASSRARVR